MLKDGNTSSNKIRIRTYLVDVLPELFPWFDVNTETHYFFNHLLGYIISP